MSVSEQKGTFGTQWQSLISTQITLLLFAVVVVSASSDLPSLSAEKILIVMIGRMLEEVRLLLLEA